MPDGSVNVTGFATRYKLGPKEVFYLTKLEINSDSTPDVVVDQCQSNVQPSKFEFQSPNGAEVLSIAWKCTNHTEGHMDVYITKKNTLLTSWLDAKVYEAQSAYGMCAKCYEVRV